jgi:ABC-2 type transport system permease protein
LWRGASDLLASAGLTLALMSPVALFASMGRGYLPPLSWALLTIFLAQIVAALGWGAWFPWSVPALFSGLAGPRAAQVGLQSYALVALTCATGLVGTLAWWHNADQTR